MEKIALTLLTCYPDIPSYVEGIEAVIWRTALYSYSGTSLKKFKTTFSQAREIVVLIDKRNDLLFIKSLVENTLERMTEKQKLLAKRAFFEKKSVEQLQKELGLTRRTLYRRIHSLLNSFGKILLLEDFDNEWFFEACLTQSWIKSIYNNQSKLLP
jgi:hypothetical protein